MLGNIHIQNPNLQHLQDESHQQQGTSPTAPSDLVGDQLAAQGDQGVISRDEPILSIPSGDDDAAEEGCEGLHDQDVPGAKHEDSSAHPEDQVAEPERRSAETQKWRRAHWAISESRLICAQAQLLDPQDEKGAFGGSGGGFEE